MTNGTVKKQSPTLCSLTDDWQERISDSPRSKGKKLKYRYTIVATKFCWTLAIENDSEISIGKKYGPGFQQLVCTFLSEAGLDPVDCLKRIDKSLSQLTGKPTCLKIVPGDPPLVWIEMAKQIDVYYNVDYSVVEDSIRARLFGDDEDEEDE